MENRIKKIVKEKFNANLIKSIPLLEGYSHKKFIIELDEYPYEAVIKFENISCSDKKRGLIIEKFVIDRLAKEGIPVPKIFAFNDLEENLNEHYIILEKLEGFNLNKIWDYLSKKEQIQIIKEIGKLLSRIHKIKLEKFGNIINYGEIEARSRPFKFNNPNDGLKYSPYIREIMTWVGEDIGKLFSFENIDRKIIYQIFNYIEKRYDIFTYIGEPTLIHGDFHKDHIFVKKEGNLYKIIGVLDPEFASAGRPEYDLVKLDRQCLFEDEELKNAFEEGYGLFNLDVVKILRILRDFSFGLVLLDSGDLEKAEKIFQDIKIKIES